MSDNSKLSALGIDPARLTEEQRGVLSSLSDEEINVLANVKHQMDTADGDVQGHSGDDVGVLLY
jgi:hypothetical protein